MGVTIYVETLAQIVANAIGASPTLTSARHDLMPTPIVDSPAVKVLSRALKGSVVQRGDFDYDKLRMPWLEVIDQKPALIIEAASVNDVIAAVAFARDQDLPIGVMSTGHGIAAACDGVLLRFTKKKHVSVDPSRGVATVGPGLVHRNSSRQRKNTTSCIQRDR